MVTLKQGYKAYQISQEFIEDFKEKSKEKSTTDPASRRRSGSSQQEADSKEMAQKEKSESPSGESSESGGEGESGSNNDRRLSKDCGDRSGGDDASLAEKPSQELRKMDTEL